jgi:hypothetical protein
VGPSSRRVARFALHFVPIFAALALLYPFVLRPYGRLLCALANPIAATLVPPLRFETADSGAWNILRTDRQGPERGVVALPLESLRQIHLGIVLLPPLLLATPVPLRTRLRLLAVGLAVLIALQVAAHLTVGWAWAHYPEEARHGPVFQVVVLAHGTSGQVLPVIVWGLVAWAAWFAPFRAATRRGAGTAAAAQ